MSYKHMFEDESNVSSVTKISVDQFKFTDQTPELIGKVEKIEDFANKKFSKNPAKRYTFDTDDGKKTVILPQNFNIQYGDVLKPGVVARIIYKGQKQLSGNKRVNMYEVFVIGKSELIKNNDRDTEYDESSTGKASPFGKRK